MTRSTHGRDAYEDRLTRLVRQGHSYVRYGVVDGKRAVVFKAEVGVVGGKVAQIQGVWVHPALRGRGLGRRGWPTSCATCAPITHPPCRCMSMTSIRRRCAAYEAVGFERVGTFATVMF